MRRRLADLVLVFVAGLRWFGSAYVALSALVPPAALPCALLNLILGYAFLLIVTRSHRGARLFYQGSRGEEKSSPLIALVWALLLSLLILGLLWWIGRGLFHNLS